MLRATALVLSSSSATRLICSAAMVCGSLTAVANAHWTVVNLHPADAASSTASGVHGSQQQVGTAMIDGVARAGLWTGTADTWVDLHPTRAISSDGAAVDVNQQVGSTNIGGDSHAALWIGTADSWVDLHPAGAFSEARDVCGIRQVGYVGFGGPLEFVLHAAIWTGTAASWVDLHPPGLPMGNQSRANATDCAQQIGFTRVNSAPQVSFRAALWSGTAGSWVNLHPAGASASIAHGVHLGQQVGEIRNESLQQRASLWTGTAASWVNLHPVAATNSIAYSVHNGQQVGEAEVSKAVHASFWEGEADSWVDLHAFLPAEFTTSTARAISHDGVSIYVVGWGFNSATRRDEALMWVRLCPADINADGVVDVDDLLAVINSWGACPAAPAACPANINDAGTSSNRVDVDDLLAVINAWGPCPSRDAPVN